MENNLIDFVSYKEGVQDVKCLVVGDIILDRYLYGDVSRISPEAPIPVVHVNSEKYVLGGAANVACNIIGCKVKCYLCGIVGTDFSGQKVLHMLKENRIEYIGTVSGDRVTTTKTRVTGMNQQIVRLDEEMNTTIGHETEDILMKQIEDCIDEVRIIVVSDYNKGVCTERLCKRLIELSNRKKKTIIIDPKSRDWSKYNGADLITPNFKEFDEVIDKNIENTEDAIREHVPSLIKKFNLGGILVTRSQYGMTYVDKNNHYTSYATAAQEVYDVSGAGDTVIAAIAAFKAAGYPTETAIEISNYAAAIAVSKLGTYVVSIDELVNYLDINKVSYLRKIVNRDKVSDIISNWKKDKKKIVFTNGCFDILHIGHITYLSKAKLLGDKLIIGVNTDRSVKALKGDNRPINSEHDRAQLLAALSFVDLVVLFDEETPYNLLSMIKPDILVKGGDYKIEEVIGREFADEVILLPFIEGYSTTKTVNKMNNI